MEIDFVKGRRCPGQKGGCLGKQKTPSEEMCTSEVVAKIRVVYERAIAKSEKTAYRRGEEMGITDTKLKHFLSQGICSIVTAKHILSWSKAILKS